MYKAIRTLGFYKVRKRMGTVVVAEYCGGYWLLPGSTLAYHDTDFNYIHKTIIIPSNQTEITNHDCEPNMHV